MHFFVVRRAGKVLEHCSNATYEALENRVKYESLTKPPVGRRPDFERRIALTKEQEESAWVALKKARFNQESVTEAKREISKVYHPYDLLTGDGGRQRICSLFYSAEANSFPIVPN